MWAPHALSVQHIGLRWGLCLRQRGLIEVRVQQEPAAAARSQRLQRLQAARAGAGGKDVYAHAQRRGSRRRALIERPRAWVGLPLRARTPLVSMRACSKDAQQHAHAAAAAAVPT